MKKAHDLICITYRFSFCKYHFWSLDVSLFYSWSLYVNTYSPPVMNMLIYSTYSMDDSKLWKTVFHAEHGRYWLKMSSFLLPVLSCGKFSWKTKIHPWCHDRGGNGMLCFLEASLATSEILFAKEDISFNDAVSNSAKAHPQLICNSHKWTQTRLHNVSLL